MLKCSLLFLDEHMEQENLGIIDTLKHNVMEFLNNPDAILAILTKLGTALIIFWVGKKVAQLMAHLVNKGLTKSGVAPILVNFLNNFVYYLLLAVVISQLWESWDQTTSLSDLDRS